ncbi:hypothetical protein BDP55DRAFT_327676 [Colletotrichum godetiae]|uniref:Uncharacterized protein n=1 Tax=Colletotrichum godetiae TaxID=1209918 RepID=A0AAJ0AB30_9PEZI|nr:uncharacterized protein BDP55DRAFT_327676 [Colletotrichum godetiae]KAK1659847.1 hypothetical protein BDP55DRAFT_327676 [Colletotrichum godetiae]
MPCNGCTVSVSLVTVTAAALIRTRKTPRQRRIRTSPSLTDSLFTPGSRASLPSLSLITGLRSALPRSGQPGAKQVEFSSSGATPSPSDRHRPRLRGHEYWIMRLRMREKATTRCRLRNKLTAWHCIPHLPLSLFNLIDMILHVSFPDSPSPRRPRSHDATCAPRCQVPVTLCLVRPPPPFILHKIFSCLSAVPRQPSHRLQALVPWTSRVLKEVQPGLPPRHKCQVFSDERWPRKLTFVRPQRGTHQT